MTRPACHRREVLFVATRLRAAGHHVVVAYRSGAATSARGDILVDNTQWVAVLVAHTGRQQKRVRWRGRVYKYNYPSVRWNLQTHGRQRFGVDAYVFIWRPDARRRRCYIVPSSTLAGRWTLVVLASQLKADTTWLARYRDQWPLVSVTAVVTASTSHSQEVRAA